MTTFLIIALADLTILFIYFIGMARCHFIMPHLAVHPDDYHWAHISETIIISVLLMMFIMVVDVGLDPSLNGLSASWTFGLYVTDAIPTCFMIIMTNYCASHSMSLGDRYRQAHQFKLRQ